MSVREKWEKNLIKLFMKSLYINITYICAVCGILIVLYQRKARNVGRGEMEMKANGVRS